MTALPNLPYVCVSDAANRTGEDRGEKSGGGRGLKKRSIGSDARGDGVIAYCSNLVRIQSRWKRKDMCTVDLPAHRKHYTKV